MQIGPVAQFEPEDNKHILIYLVTQKLKNLKVVDRQKYKLSPEEHVQDMWPQLKHSVGHPKL